MGNSSSASKTREELEKDLHTAKMHIENLTQDIINEKKHQSEREKYTTKLEYNIVFGIIGIGCFPFAIMYYMRKPFNLQIQIRQLSEELTEKIKSVRSLTTLSEDLKMKLRGVETDLEKAKLFGITNFSKDIVEVSDNIGRFREKSVVDRLPPHIREMVVNGDFQKNHLNVDTKISDSEHALTTILEGIQLTEQSLTKVLEKHGVQKHGDTPQETEFNPEIHDALFVCNETPKNVIAKVERAGYSLNGRCIRPTRVGVGGKIVEVEAVVEVEAAVDKNQEAVSEFFTEIPSWAEELPIQKSNVGGTGGDTGSGGTELEKKSLANNMEKPNPA